jgi:hypothetical protein
MNSESRWAAGWLVVAACFVMPVQGEVPPPVAPPLVEPTGQVSEPATAPAKEAASAAATLKVAVGQMEEAASGLKATGGEASVIEKQRGALTAIDQLLEQAKKQPPPNGSPQSSQSNKSKSTPKPQDSTGREQAEPKPKKSAGQETEPTKAGNDTQSGQSKPSDGGADSTEELRQREAAIRLAQQRALLEQNIWGHLPPALRDELLSGYADRMLPGYEELIQNYYQRLAKPRKK